MKKIIAVFLIAFSVQMFSQPENFRKQNFRDNSLPKLLFTQTLILPADSLFDINYIYKIPYQNIVFLKNGGGYNAGLRVDVEVTDTNSRFITREIKDWKISASSFEETNSSETFAEGLINLKLSSGSYLLQPIVTDQNSKREFKLKPERVDVKSSLRIEPLIVESEKVVCYGKEFFKLANFEGNISFGSHNQSLIIPINNISAKEINVTVVAHKDTIAEETLTESFISSLDFNECSGYIIISDGSGTQTNNFVLNGISGQLREGAFTVIINNEDDKKFNGFVTWYNKPNSLRFPELSIKALKHIESEKVIDSLLDIDDEKQYKELFNFWKEKDPTPETEYNELMAEYYSRVDYVQSNFSSLTGKKGLDTDRGKIFIKFGKPTQIERASNEKGKIVETWIYTKPQRKFVFVDKQGVGEFSLESS